MTKTVTIANIAPETREDIRYAVDLALRYWPNSHLGDYSPHEDMRSAFRRIRQLVERGHTVGSAAREVEIDACRHANM